MFHILPGYILQYRSSSLTEWSFHPLGSRLTSFVLDNLLCGTAYQIRLAGENSIGMGEFSQMLRTKTTGSPPEQHPKLTEVIDGNGTMIRIDLNRWPNVRKCQLFLSLKLDRMEKLVFVRNLSASVNVS